MLGRTPMRYFGFNRESMLIGQWENRSDFSSIYYRFPVWYLYMILYSYESWKERTIGAQCQNQTPHRPPFLFINFISQQISNSFSGIHERNDCKVILVRLKQEAWLYTFCWWIVCFSSSENNVLRVTFMSLFHHKNMSRTTTVHVFATLD
jgi:hypothetical protein